MLWARSPADVLEKGDPLRPGNPLEELPAEMEKRFRNIVNKRYNGDMAAAISAFLTLHGKR